ncbi:MAG: D-alanyl-D-alanine carboxypeptidase family protein [Pseudomonadota bacterium]
MRLALALWLLLVAPAAWAVEQFETLAPAAILVDWPSGQVLFEKNADEPRPPASMSKLMTAFMVFERLQSGAMTLDDTMLVSETAWRKGGSKMWVEVGDRVPIEDLLRGIIIQSGNDACIVVAEGIAGTEAAFAEQMTRRASDIGLTNSVFKNASGWPDPEHVMSVRDLATLALRLISEFPEYYHYYSQRSFTYAGIEQSSRNPLLQGNVEGVDGLKTGHTREAGYGLVASAERDGRRLVLVVAGLETPGQRRREAERLLEYGFSAYRGYQLFAPDEPVADAAVWFGERATVPLVTEAGLLVTMSPTARDELEVTLAYDSPLSAPLTAGSPAGELVLRGPEIGERRIPLLVGEDVAEANLVGRMWTALRHLMGS